ncbi:CBO0543 family protein [Ectobacillus funiculus]|uniref:CBO0543 family protein n=1 Tax=Ectobacillus funiculus TaxID=137993 RepID=UPI00101D11CF|nr:CBO0543 family protein [Ectobacillus funiculus]
MNSTIEKTTLKSLFLFGVFAFFNLVRKPLMKDWLIIFFLKSYISSILNVIAVKKGYLKYPVPLFKTFDVSVLFSYILFPISCVYYNQLTKNSNIFGMIVKAMCFSIPMTIVENWLEQNTRLIEYKKSWDWKYTFSSITTTFLIVRFIMGIIRKGTHTGYSAINKEQ